MIDFETPMKPQSRTPAIVNGLLISKYALLWPIAIGLLGAGLVAPAQELSTQVSCPVVVRDSRGIVLRALAPADFESSVPIISISQDLRPRRIAIVLDASASMREGGPFSDDWKLAMDITEHLSRQGAERAQLALLVFNSSGTEIIDFGKGNAAVLGRIHDIASDKHFAQTAVRGHTPLYDTLEKAVALFPSPAQADTLFVITDAGDNASHITPKKLGASLLDAHVRLFGVVFAHSLGYRNKTPEELNSALPDLQGPAEKSGGSLFGPILWLPAQHVFQVASLKEHISISEALTRYYVGIFENTLVTIRLSALQPSDWKLQLSKQARDRFPQAHVEYPVNLKSCGPGNRLWQTPD